MAPSIAGNHSTLLAAEYQIVFHQLHTSDFDQVDSPNPSKGYLSDTIAFYVIPDYVNKNPFTGFVIDMCTGKAAPRHPAFPESDHIAIFKYKALGTMTFACNFHAETETLTNVYIVGIHRKMRALLFPPTHRFVHATEKRDQSVLFLDFRDTTDTNGNKFLALELYTEVEQDSASLYRPVDEVAKDLGLRESKYRCHEYYGKKLIGAACGDAGVELAEVEAVALGIDTEGWPWGWVLERRQAGRSAGITPRKTVGWALPLDNAGIDEKGPLKGYETSDDDDYMDEGEAIEEED